ncbi:upf0577 protein kiaa1324-like homolog [Plakobranchus ocellatus]|uniref:Upf0577 protein kiaa1324-like homolog n=1 Tax=Plakobranchus ocellatus TaxID=259542 RepID=A0AAV4AHP8_9GAST|nr:upf0577 protein kiaa1324-like homolog [Plakobranchus ocellatus]
MLSAVTAQLRPCQLADYHYEYTECDSEGGRWRVSVPKAPGLCSPSGSSIMPVRGKDCNFACSPGEYLDMADQECHPCEAGSFSLGGGVRFSDWSELPQGFAVRTEEVKQSSWGVWAQKSKSVNCSRSGWTPRGAYIMAMPGMCPSNLLFSAKLVKAGKVSFEYQYTDAGAIFHFMEVVEDLSGVTQDWCIKVRRSEDKVQIDTIILTFDSPKPANRIHMGYLTLGVRPFSSSSYHQENSVSQGSILSPMLFNLKGHIDWSANRATLLRLYSTLVRSKLDYCSVVYVGIPAHIGIHGNETVDKVTKAALNRPPSLGKLICWSDLKPKVNTYIHIIWRENWDAEVANKHNEVFPDLGEDLGKKGEGAGRQCKTVQNDQCQASGKENEKWPVVTEKGKWATVVVNLKSGMNVLQWRTIGAFPSMTHSVSSPILIRKIEITGVAYTSECTKCPNGTYSSRGSSFCQTCPPNTFSLHGASGCTKCKDSEYSEAGSVNCLPRPPCTQFDYYKYQKPCDDFKKTQQSYRWIEPKICSETVTGSVKLPKDWPMQDCPPCSPGMHRINASYCGFCEPNQYADIFGDCVDCPVSTSPDYKIDYQHWTNLPPNMSTQCVSVGDETCTNSAGWLPAGDHLRTSFGLSDRNMFLVLLLRLAGLKGEPSVVDGKPMALGSIEFEIELNCPSPCQLIFLSDLGNSNTVIQSWENTLSKKKFSHDIYTNESVVFTWAFQPDDFGLDADSEGYDGTLKMKNFAKIYSIHVSNTISGGASSCLMCPKGKSSEGCIPCPDGQYIDPLTQACQLCPPGTVLPSSNQWGKKACKPCGPGLHAVGGRSCQSDCTFTDNLGRNYDFSSLNSVRFIAGSRLFTGSGTQYFHGFNISLCNHGNQPLPMCVNNVTRDAMSPGSKRVDIITNTDVCHANFNLS